MDPNCCVELTHCPAPGLGQEDAIEITLSPWIGHGSCNDRSGHLFNRWEMALANGERWRFANLTRRRAS